MPTTDVNLNNLVFHDIPRNIYDTITPEENQIYFVEENKSVEERVADVLNNYTPTSNLANVALSGEYNDLSNKPTIPPAQVQSDWDAVSGMGVILNKPTLGDMAFVDTVDYSNITNTPSIPVVDATYNALSSNAQSGIAVESAFNSKFVVTNVKPSVTDPNTFYFITEE